LEEKEVVMSVLKATVLRSDGMIMQCDVIEYQNEFWLVPEWLDIPARGLTQPRRIIRMAAVPHQPPAMKGHDFVVNDPIPIEIFEGRADSALAKRYGAQELPDIFLPLPKRGLH
jgi:hypothetical protein